MACSTRGRDGALETHRLLVRLRPAKAHHPREQPLHEGVSVEDGVCRAPPGGCHGERAVRTHLDQPIRGQATHHLRRCLDGDTHPT